MSELLYGFPPVYRADARVLILGSMPSVASLEEQFYYAHPRNAFWPIMAEILGEALPRTIAEKKELLMRHQIALWDTVASCERAGSLDSAIRAASANDFAGLYKDCPGIDSVFFNGAAAATLYRKLGAPVAADMRFVRLPSTSPAYTLPYAKKLAIWQNSIMEAFKHERM